MSRTKSYDNRPIYKTFKTRNIQNIYKNWSESLGGIGNINRAVRMIRSTDWLWAEITNEEGRTIRFESTVV